MKIRKPWHIRVVGTLAAGALRLLNRTVRARLALAGPEQHPVGPEHQRYVYVFWHESIVALTAWRIKAHVLASQHADGELMARVCRHLGIGVVRGSSTRGGSAALLGLLRRAGATHVALTPDGPVGPPKRVKAGALALASMSGMPVVPVGVACTKAWRARSWDRMMVPLPWSRSFFVTGPAMHVPTGLDRAGLERYCRQTEAALAVVNAAAARWAAGGPRPVPAPPLSACA